jgi:hypothetical protein
MPNTTVRPNLNLTFRDVMVENPLFSTEEATNCLINFANDRDIVLHDLSVSKMHDFVEVLRYTPSDIRTEQVAREVGLIPTEEMPVSEAVSMIGHGNSSSVPVYTSSYDSPFIDEDLDLFSPDAYTNFVNSVQSTVRKQRKVSVKEMMAQKVRSEGFPRPNFINWMDRSELNNIVNDWYRNVEYKEHWIFSRREREGFNRRNIGFFSLEDVMSRLSKRKRPHELDTKKSKFYDWKLGGTDWTLRLELYQDEEQYFLISRYIHNPSNAEIKYDVRYWNIDRFVAINGIISEHHDNDKLFDRVFGSTDENSPYYCDHPLTEAVDDGEHYENEDFYDDVMEEDWDD